MKDLETSEELPASFPAITLFSVALAVIDILSGIPPRLEWASRPGPETLRNFTESAAVLPGTGGTGLYAASGSGGFGKY